MGFIVVQVKLILYHPAALRTTDSREAQLLHGESWHPETM